MRLLAICKDEDATFQPAMDMLNKDGMDVQVFVYDKDACRWLASLGLKVGMLR
jgi:hypothetical protein